MHPCPGNWMAIGHAVVHCELQPTHIAQELHVGTGEGRKEVIEFYVVFNSLGHIATR